MYDLIVMSVFIKDSPRFALKLWDYGTIKDLSIYILLNSLT